jgi:hypothetical protein
MIAPSEPSPLITSTNILSHRRGQEFAIVDGVLIVVLP